MSLSAIPEWLREPALLPHQIDFSAAEAIFLPTRREDVEAASFLDGRTHFASGPAIGVPLDQLIASPTSPIGPCRYIFHIGFCGSTFLSRLVDRPSCALVLREPNVLANLANVRAAIDRGEILEDRLGATLKAVSALLNRPWATGEPVVVKPSNWVNNLLPDLCLEPGAIRPVFLTMERGNFLRAVFRGGSSRLAFAARAVVHLSSRRDADAMLVNTALAEGTDFQKLSRLAVVLHYVQLSLFECVARDGGWGADNWLTCEQLQADPAGAARKAASVLDIDLPDEIILQNQQRWSASNAKNPALAYSPAEERRSARELDAANHAHISDALAWAETAIDLEN